MIESNNLYRFSSLLAGVTFSRYPANNETADNKGVLYTHFSVIFYGDLVLNPQIIKGKAADSKFLGTKRYPRIIKTADSKPSEGRLYPSEGSKCTRTMFFFDVTNYF